MNKNLLNKEVQDFIESHYKEETSKMAFQGSPFEDVSTRELLTQLSGKKKADKKLPTWFSTSGIIYPPNTNLEQTSSEVTACYKASLVSGGSLVDLTGGFGIDSYYFSKQVEQVYHLEVNEDLQEVAAHNFDILNAKNIISKSGDGIEFLKKFQKNFDWIYVDPSRRDDSGGRVFMLSDCLPNVPKEIELLQKKGRKIIVKTSPLLDLQAGLRELTNVREIHIIAVDNEVKELLWIIEKEGSEEIRIKTINFLKQEKQVFEYSFFQQVEEKYSAPKKFLYEPNAAIMKSGLFAALGEKLELQKLHPNTQLFTGQSIIDFPGRSFIIQKILPYKKKELKKLIGSGKANITVRNFPETVENLRKILKIREGGETFLFFTSLLAEEKVVLVCQKR